MKTPQIRLVTVSDAEALYQLINRNKEILSRYFPITVSKNKTIADSQEYLISRVAKIKEKEFYPLGIFEDEKLIGMMLVKDTDWRIPKCELGYYLDKAYHGKGVMSSVVEQTLVYCFEQLKMRKVFLRIDPNNMGSKRVAEKNGFIQEGILRSEFRIETGEIVDTLYYGKLNTD